MSQPGSDPNNPGTPGDRPAIRPISLRSFESTESASPSGSLPAPLKLQPLSRNSVESPTPANPQRTPVSPTSRPEAPPVPSGYLGPTRPGETASAPPPASATPSKIEFQQLERKDSKPQSPRGYAGVSIPPRPANRKSAEIPPKDPSGVVPRDWPPPHRVDLQAGGSGTVPVDQVSPAPRFLPGPETTPSGSGRGFVSLRPGEETRVPLGPPPQLDDSPSRGGMDTDSKASWSDNKEVSTSESSRSSERGKAPRPPMGKGPIILVTAFTAVLLAVLIWPPKNISNSNMAVTKESPTPLTDITSTSNNPLDTASPANPETPLFSETPATSASPLAALTPEASETPVAIQPSITNSPIPVAPTPEATASAIATAQPVITETPQQVAANNPKPTVTPKPIVEEPPAKNTTPTGGVRLSVIPAHVDAKVYLVNEQNRYSDHSAGSVRLQQIKPGTYTLKVIASGYETFSKKIEVKEDKDNKLSVRLARIPAPSPPSYTEPPPNPSYNPGNYQPPPPPRYNPPPPASGGSYQITAPGI